MKGNTNTTDLRVAEIEKNLADAIKNMPIINLGYKTNIDFTYSTFQGYPKVGNIYVYVADYFVGGENLVLGYHYMSSNYGAQLKFKFGTPGLEFRRCSGGSWGAWTTIAS